METPCAAWVEPGEIERFAFLFGLVHIRIRGEVELQAPDRSPYALHQLPYKKLPRTSNSATLPGTSVHHSTLISGTTHVNEKSVGFQALRPRPVVITKVHSVVMTCPEWALLPLSE